MKLKKSVVAHASVYFFSGLSFVVLVLLLFQYYNLQRVSLELMELKEDYRVYTLAIKRLLDKESSTQGVMALANQKKKLNWVTSCVQEEKQFLTINRDQEYLLAGALLFAKKHNLVESVAQIFDVKEWEKKVRPQLKTKKAHKRKGPKFVGIPAGKGMLKPGKQTSKDFIFSWPLDQSKFWLSSLFGPRKLKGKGWKYHYGVDMAALKGTPVKAAATGIVLESYWHNGYGNCIIVAHNRKYKTRYAHLNTRKVRIGQKVKRGEIIGTVGDTGLVRKSGKDASHLHFEVYAFGRHVNPLSVLV